MRTGGGTREAMVELGGQGPLGLSPRFEVSPSPSCPPPLLPQHLTVASSCSEKHPRINDLLRICNRGTSFIEGLQARWSCTRSLTRFWFHGSGCSALRRHMLHMLGCGSAPSGSQGARWPHSVGPRLPISHWVPYQKSTRVIHPCADGCGCPSRPQVDRSEIRPHLCTRTAGTRVRTREAGTREAAGEFGGHCRRWRSNPFGKFSQERLSRGTVTSTMRRAARPAGRAVCSVLALVVRQ